VVGHRNRSSTTSSYLPAACILYASVPRGNSTRHRLVSPLVGATDRYRSETVLQTVSSPGLCNLTRRSVRPKKMVYIPHHDASNLVSDSNPLLVLVLLESTPLHLPLTHLIAGRLKHNITISIYYFSRLEEMTALQPLIICLVAIYALLSVGAAPVPVGQRPLPNHSLPLSVSSPLLVTCLLGAPARCWLSQEIPQPRIR